VLNRAGPVAERFYRYLQGPAARALLQKSGFAVPE
jgi:ABC-type molybdate transport system substrate-binding protein